MVEWKPLNNIVSSISTGLNPRTNFILNENDANLFYVTVKEITSNKVVFSDNTDKISISAKDIINRRSKLETGDILFSGIGTIGKVAYVDIKTDNWDCSESVFLIKPNDSKIKGKYLYYILTSDIAKKQYEKSSAGAIMKGIRKRTLESLQIPIPSLSEQNHIVGILDTFTDSIENLKQQIAQRRKQYEFYRDQLLDNISISTKIGELTKVFSCPRVYKDQWQDSGIPFWRSSDVMSYYNGVKNPRGEVFISQSLYDKLLQKSEKIEKGDILVTGGGSIGIPYLKKDNNPLFVKDADLICIKKCESIIPSFLYHFFFSTSFRLYLKKITHDATIAHYTISQIIETPIPVPSLSEQQRIVSILDTFEASISNLEAQLIQRQKQYEYYRNKLLTFK